MVYCLLVCLFSTWLDGDRLLSIVALVFIGCNNLFISHACTVQVGTKVDDYWEPGKALLQDPGKFLESLFKFDKVKILTCITST